MRKQNTIEDFLALVDTSKGENECHPYMGGRYTQGYGCVTMDGARLG